MSERARGRAAAHCRGTLLGAVREGRGGGAARPGPTAPAALPGRFPGRRPRARGAAIAAGRAAPVAVGLGRGAARRRDEAQRRDRAGWARGWR